MNTFLCILDYGSGNVRSVYNLVSQLTQNVVISNDEKDIKRASHIILPGVGAFSASMEKIHARIPLQVLEKEVFVKKKPFLGICVGMQVLADYGYEFGKCKGLGWVSGIVKKIETEELPLPHVGWNEIHITKQNELTKRFTGKPDFYFVHSYIFHPNNSNEIVATTTYGETFCSILGKENIFGVQFHPEKSQTAGKILLENFLKL